jgi:membrane protease YdiL (CAAX protease family)
MPAWLVRDLLRWYPQNWVELIPWLVGIALIPGIAEETLFRGFVQNGLQQSWSRTRALIMASVLFGVLHLSPWQIPYAILFGFVAGYLFFRTNSIYTTISMHITMNSVSSVSGFFKVQMAAPVWESTLLLSTLLLATIIIYEKRISRRR